MSTGFIWLCTQTFRWHRCTALSDVCQLDSSGCVHRHSDGTAVTDWAVLSVRHSEMATQTVFRRIWTVQLLITTHNIISVLANTVLLLCGQGTDIRPRQTSGVVISVWWRHCTEFPGGPTDKTAGTLRPGCVFCNCMEYSAAWDVFIVESTESY